MGGLPARRGRLRAGRLRIPGQLEGDLGPLGVSSKVAAVVAVHAPTGFHAGAPVGKHTSPLNALLGREGGTEAEPWTEQGRTLPTT